VQPPPEAFGSLQTMSILLPLMIVLVLYDMPAGAVLYWLTQTGAAVALQLFYNRKMARREGEIPGG
jgi:membrane protein insertase Oxa1/YidC/SpoIIIJ